MRVLPTAKNWGRVVIKNPLSKNWHVLIFSVLWLDDGVLFFCSLCSVMVRPFAGKIALTVDRGYFKIEGAEGFDYRSASGKGATIMQSRDPQSELRFAPSLFACWSRTGPGIPVYAPRVRA